MSYCFVNGTDRPSLHSNNSQLRHPQVDTGDPRAPGLVLLTSSAGLTTPMPRKRNPGPRRQGACPGLTLISEGAGAWGPGSGHPPRGPLTRKVFRSHSVSLRPLLRRAQCRHVLSASSSSRRVCSHRWYSCSSRHQNVTCAHLQRCRRARRTRCTARRTHA